MEMPLWLCFYPSNRAAGAKRRVLLLEKRCLEHRLVVMSHINARTSRSSPIRAG